MGGSRKSLQVACARGKHERKKILLKRKTRKNANSLNSNVENPESNAAVGLAAQQNPGLQKCEKIWAGKQP